MAVKVTDEETFSVSESTVYRILKANNMVAPRPLDQMPAAKEWKHRTNSPDEIWQTDATNFFVVGWGYYKAIPVLDDYSRKVLACPVKRDETSFSISDAIEEARENAEKEGHQLEPKPILLSDNGSGFCGEVLEKYLKVHGIRHIFGQPYHPQTQGKVEALNKKLKGRVNLLVYCSPEELERAVKEAIRIYNATPHEALKNVSPNDVYAGRQEEILKRRAEKKRLTLQKRKRYNLAWRPESLSSDNANLSQKF
jgi:transposase InsO family protein